MESKATMMAETLSSTFTVLVDADSSYLVEQPSNPTTSLTYAQITGSQPMAYKSLGGKVQIGLP
jgi:hypothetical protein